MRSFAKFRRLTARSVVPASLLPVALAVLLAGCSTPGEPPPAESERAEIRLERDVPPVAASTESPLTRVLLAELAVSRGQLAAASHHYGLAVEDSRDPALITRALQVAVLARDPKQTLTLADRWEALDSGNADMARLLKAEALVIKGRRLRQERDYPGSIAAFDRGLALEPRNLVLRYGRALSRVMGGELQAGIDDLTDLHAEEPDNPHFLNALGYTLVDATARVDEGAELIKKAYRLRPDDPAIIDSMGWAAYRQGRMNEALEYLRRAFALTEGDAEIAAHLGEVLWMLNHRDEARDIWNEGLEHSADHPVLQETLERLTP